MKLFISTMALGVDLMSCLPAIASDPTEKDAIAMAERGAALVRGQ